MPMARIAATARPAARQARARPRRASTRPKAARANGLGNPAPCATLVPIVNNRKEVIQCLIVNRRGRRQRPGSSPSRSAPRDVNRHLILPDRGPTMEGLPRGQPFLFILVSSTAVILRCIGGLRPPLLAMKNADAKHRL